MKYERKITTFGFVNVLKPSGVSSSVAVNRLKRITGQPCGHMGTLDPLADGVLPVGIGNATRLFDFFLKKEKEYIAEFTFGKASDTLDSTGNVVVGGNIPTESDILSVIPSLTGEVAQIPPKYSAKSVNGVRGYDLARKGVDFSLPPKTVKIDEIKLLGKGKNDNSFKFLIRCGAGTYIRSIARDMAEILQTNALMSALTRTKSGCFELDNAFPMDEIDEKNILSLIIPTEKVIPLPELRLSEEKAFHGIAVPFDTADGEYKVWKDGEFYGLASVQNGVLKIGTKLC